jgi:hypothetical protein
MNVDSDVMRICRKIFVFAVVGASFGFFAGCLGTFIEHRNEVRFGASYSSFEYQWLALLLSLPGTVAAHITYTHDWRVDEAWHFRHVIWAWNTLFWGALASVVALFHGLITPVKTHQAVTPPSTAASHHKVL